MTSPTDIANLALGRLGIGQAIASIDDNSQPARICKRFYDQCRREVLRDHPWGFASTYQTIAEVTETFPGWQYVYQYPNDALMVWAVADESGIRGWSSCYAWYCCGNTEPLIAFRQRYPFKQALGADRDTRVLLSDVPDAVAFFTFDVDNTAIYPADFVSALADRLAMEVGGPLRVDANLIALAGQRYTISKAMATAQDMNERHDDPMPEADSIACRR